MVRSWGNPYNRLQLDCRRQNEPVVVVSVFADRIHAPWRSHELRICTVKLNEFSVELVD